MPSLAPPAGWQWRHLSDLARLESGHTPSRRHPEYWGGDVPWISIPDAKAHHGDAIAETAEKTNKLGIANSSARILPSGTVCLSRTASVGYVVVTARPMATSQDFVNWICGDELEPKFLQFLLLAEGSDLLRFSSGAVHKTIYFPEVKAFCVCVPTRTEQRRIVGILDEALDGIATAKANAQKNLQNAREWAARQLTTVLAEESATGDSITMESLVATGCSLSYGIVQPGDEVPGGLPVVRPVDLGAKAVRAEGLKRIAPALARSYARTTLKGGDLLLCVRGTTGTVAVAEPGLAGANVTRGIVPIRFDPKLVSQALGYYLLRSEPFQAQIRAKTYGTALMQINIGDLRKIVLSLPPIDRQADIVERLDAVQDAADQLASVYERKIAAFDELKKSLLHQAFTGQLKSADAIATAPKPAVQTTTPEFAANIIAIAHARHARQQREKTFGRVKEQKVLHVVESIGKVDLGRHPLKDAAGPNDFKHMLKAEEWAKARNFFEMVKRGEGYEFRKLSAFDEHLASARQSLEPYLPQLEPVIDLLVPMDTEDAEVFVTVHAAWNNLLIDGVETADSAIVSAAREGWHADKLKIQEHKFRSAIDLIRKKGLVPTGTAKYVGGQSSLL